MRGGVEGVRSRRPAHQRVDPLLLRAKLDAPAGSLAEAAGGVRLGHALLGGGAGGGEDDDLEVGGWGGLTGRGEVGRRGEKGEKRGRRRSVSGSRSKKKSEGERRENEKLSLARSRSNAAVSSKGECSRDATDPEVATQPPLLCPGERERESWLVSKGEAVRFKGKKEGRLQLLFCSFVLGSIASLSPSPTSRFRSSSDTPAARP